VCRCVTRSRILKVLILALERAASAARGEKDSLCSPPNRK
jgi:hypothetical protein